MLRHGSTMQVVIPSDGCLLYFLSLALRPRPFSNSMRFSVIAWELDRHLQAPGL